MFLLFGAYHPLYYLDLVPYILYLFKEVRRYLCILDTNLVVRNILYYLDLVPYILYLFKEVRRYLCILDANLDVHPLFI